MKNIDLTNHGSSLVPKPKMTDEELAEWLYLRKRGTLGAGLKSAGWDKIQSSYRESWIELARIVRANKDII